MIPLILFTQNNQRASKETTMEKQATKDASGSEDKIEKEAEPWRCEENRHRYEKNKRELILTEYGQEEMGSDLESSYGYMMMTSRTKSIKQQLSKPFRTYFLT
ncbi:hypothetical protein QL285_063131 [Trifolium repens]|nr:hypothetical protein QL285_063131 [Trifolium repens]